MKWKKSYYVNIYVVIFAKTCTKKHEIFNKKFLFNINDSTRKNRIGMYWIKKQTDDNK